ncbi:hypothetical protein [uncultured Alistipes sp.]|uniref:hypothetical protein n=1 Tax=uncultured Alistipes sp. TaxID=538949 RepID=UPI002589F387|nr:hypothetical protein [uncultured Alistipes sp.]
MNPLVHTLLPAAVLLSVLPAASQSSNPFAEQVLRYPQEKLHVHTDKDTYVAGDTIWLRARCVDAASHRPVAASRYVYAELRDESGALVRRIKILRRDSLYAGYLPVPTDAPDGDYTFSAYTRFMRNQGADYFFRKPLRIAAYRGAAGEVPKPRPRPATGDFAVTFHPEGGYLVPGRSCRVAFKALTDAGRSTAVEAVLRDDRGTTLDTVRTRRAGMGSFRMVPEAGRTYHAVCRTPSGAEKRFDLPVPNAAACVLQLAERDGFIAVNVLTAGSLPARLRLVVHCRGNRCYDGGWEPGLLFRSSDLPAGVVQWLLLDAAGNALSERLLFNEGADGVHVSLRAENPSPRRRERADFSVRLTDGAGNPLRGEFSVSVTDRNAVPDPVSGDIRTTLLLTSDLRGYVECPGSYFRSDDPEARAALDELMLTQGWRRYDVPALLRGEYAEPEYALEAGQQISGRIVRAGLVNTRKRLGMYRMAMIVPRYGYLAEAPVRADGCFDLDGFDFPDSTAFVLRPQATTGRMRNAFVKVDPETFPENGIPAHYPAAGAGDAEALFRTALAYVGYMGSADLRNVLIDPVEVRAKREIPRTLEERKAVYSWNAERIADMGVHTILDCIERMPGIRRRENVFLYQGRAVFFMCDGVLYDDLEESLPAFSAPPAIDRNRTVKRINMAGPGVPDTDSDLGSGPGSDTNASDTHLAQAVAAPIGQYSDLPPFVNLPLEWVDRIDILDRFSGRFLSGRDNGIIAVTLKSYEEISALNTGESIDVGIVSPLGYQTPAEFYSPAYETPESRDSHTPDFRTTLYWNPCIRTDADGRAAFGFRTSDAPADFRIDIEGLTPDGQPVVHAE